MGRFSQREVNELQEAFQYFDRDRDGFIGLNEVGNVMRACGLYPSEAEIAQIMKSSRSQKINFQDFMSHCNAGNVDNKINETQMREAFKVFDQYGNGLVNLVQMRTSLQSLGEKLRDDEVDELLREADIDADGNVSYEELVKILCRS